MSGEKTSTHHKKARPKAKGHTKKANKKGEPPEKHNQRGEGKGAEAGHL